MQIRLDEWVIALQSAHHIEEALTLIAAFNAALPSFERWPKRWLDPELHERELLVEWSVITFKITQMRRLSAI